LHSFAEISVIDICVFAAQFCPDSLSLHVRVRLHLRLLETFALTVAWQESVLLRNPVTGSPPPFELSVVTACEERGCLCSIGILLYGCSLRPARTFGWLKTPSCVASLSLTRELLSSPTTPS
jgi:hypothetical protein